MVQLRLPWCSGHRPVAALTGGLPTPLAQLCEELVGRVLVLGHQPRLNELAAANVDHEHIPVLIGSILALGRRSTSTPSPASPGKIDRRDTARPMWASREQQAPIPDLWSELVAHASSKSTIGHRKPATLWQPASRLGPAWTRCAFAVRPTSGAGNLRLTCRRSGSTTCAIATRAPRWLRASQLKGGQRAARPRHHRDHTGHLQPRLARSGRASRGNGGAAHSRRRRAGERVR